MRASFSLSLWFLFGCSATAKVTTPPETRNTPKMVEEVPGPGIRQYLEDRRTATNVLSTPEVRVLLQAIEASRSIVPDLPGCQGTLDVLQASFLRKPSGREIIVWIGDCPGAEESLGRTHSYMRFIVNEDDTLGVGHKTP